MEFKPLDDDVDYSKLKPLDWDLEINEYPYHVYHIEGYFHTFGGSFGENDYYCCERGNIPTKDNLIQYNNHFGPVNWGIVCNEKSRNEFKWNDTKTRQYIECYITRNNKRFYEISGGNFEYCLTKARFSLMELQEHPISFNSIYWKNELLNRKVWWRSTPGIITRVLDDGYIIIEKEDNSFFEIPPEFRKDEYEEPENNIKTNYLDHHIWWWRDE